MEEQSGDWGGSEKEFGNDERDYGNARAKDMKDAKSYERERYGKREFKGGSPLYTGKGGTIVAREGLLKSLKMKFEKNINNISMLNEKAIIEEENK